MTVQKRLLVVASLFVIASVSYGAAKYYSPSLIMYVVEQSLLQKAPSGIGSNYIRERFHALVSAAPDNKSKMEKMLRISEYLEKVQHLNIEELNQLLEIDQPERPGISRFNPGPVEHAGMTAGEHPAQ